MGVGITAVKLTALGRPQLLVSKNFLWFSRIDEKSESEML